MGVQPPSAFNVPYDIDYDAANNFLYVADNNAFKLRKIDLNLDGTNSNFVTTLAGSGTQTYQDGTGSGASFHGMMSLAVDSVAMSTSTMEPVTTSAKSALPTGSSRPLLGTVQMATSTAPGYPPKSPKPGYGNPGR